LIIGGGKRRGDWTCKVIPQDNAAQLRVWRLKNCIEGGDRVRAAGERFPGANGRGLVPAGVSGICWSAAARGKKVRSRYRRIVVLKWGGGSCEINRKKLGANEKSIVV